MRQTHTSGSWESETRESCELRGSPSARPSPVDRALRVEARGLARVLRTRLRCAICGFTEIRTDEVVDRGLVFLAECPRCDHRWTSEEPMVAAPAGLPAAAASVPPRTAARAIRGVLPAA